MNFFLSQRPRKSFPAVMSTSRETPCIKKLGVAFQNFAKKRGGGIKIPPKDLCAWWSLSLANYLFGCLRNTKLQDAKIHHHTM